MKLFELQNLISDLNPMMNIEILIRVNDVCGYIGLAEIKEIKLDSPIDDSGVISCYNEPENFDSERNYIGPRVLTLEIDW